MSTYANIMHGAVAEIITPPAPIAECYSPAFVAGLVDVSAVTPAPQPGWTATETAGAWTFAAPVAPTVDMRPAAQAALDRSDITIIRCYEHAVPAPAAWATYRGALRAIVAGGPTSAALPVQPAYPAGT